MVVPVLPLWLKFPFKGVDIKMIKIIDIQESKNKFVSQRLSDASDRQEITITTYDAKIANNNKIYILTFDHEPTEQEITDAIANGQATESNDPLDKILLKQIQQEEMIEILTMMLLEKDGVL